MITLSNVEELKGSILTVTRTGDKREAYSVRGELIAVSAHRIILSDVKSGRTRRIPLERVISIAELDSDFKILKFLLDGSGAALCSKKEVNENE